MKFRNYLTEEKEDHVKSKKETLDQDDYSRKAFLNDLSAIVKITCFDDSYHNNDFNIK